MVGLALGALATVGGGFAVHRLYAPILAESRRAERAATDRLVAAWKEGAQVPPAPDDTPQAHLQPLPTFLQDYCDQFDEAGRAVYEARARTHLSDGVEPQNVIRHLEAARAQRGEVFAEL